MKYRELEIRGQLYDVYEQYDFRVRVRRKLRTSNVASNRSYDALSPQYLPWVTDLESVSLDHPL